MAVAKDATAATTGIPRASEVQESRRDDPGLRGYRVVNETPEKKNRRNRAVT
jgi:hypothetical protein